MKTQERVLITGGAGFIGTALARRLLAIGRQVSILDVFLPQVHGSDKNLPPDLRGKVRLFRGDAADPALLARAAADAGCVVHLAAETGTGQSMYEMARYARTNALATCVLGDLLVGGNHKIRSVVLSSSRSVYGEGAYSCRKCGPVYPKQRTELPRGGSFDPACPVCGSSDGMTPGLTKETSPLSPVSIYAITKQFQEQVLSAACGRKGISLTIFRFQNVYGPGQSLLNPYTGLLSVFFSLASQNKPIQVFEDGLESRDFVYIDDISAIVAKAVCAPPSGVWVANVGGGARHSVLDVARRVIRHMGSRSEIKITGAFRAGDIRHNQADLAESVRLFKYKPRTDFDYGLRNFLKWAAASGHSRGWSSVFEASLREMKQRGLFHVRRR